MNFYIHIFYLIKRGVLNEKRCKVFVSKIDYKLVLEYYNQHKKNDDMVLEKLDRCEGGFQIRIVEKQNENIDVYKKIRQLRWNSGYLVSSHSHIPFTNEEELLLFESLQHVLGKDNVIME